jgi:hypothetical protein
METWAWLGAYLLGFALLQVYLYMYFMRGRTTTGDRSHESTPSTPSESSSAPVSPPDGLNDSELLCCESCGTYNRSDPMFVYCKECGTRLD